MSATQREISDAAVRKATGKGWDEWFALLDSEGAEALPHKQIARLLHDRGYIASSWWCQMVTVGYERARGKRVLGETESAGFVADADFPGRGSLFGRRHVLCIGLEVRACPVPRYGGLPERGGCFGCQPGLYKGHRE